MTRLFILCACSVLMNTCAKVETPAEPQSYTVENNQIVISRWVNGGVWICAEDTQGMTRGSCVQVQEFRRYVQSMRMAE